MLSNFGTTDSRMPGSQAWFMSCTGEFVGLCIAQPARPTRQIDRQPAIESYRNPDRNCKASLIASQSLCWKAFGFLLFRATLTCMSFRLLPMLLDHYSVSTFTENDRIFSQSSSRLLGTDLASPDHRRGHSVCR